MIRILKTILQSVPCCTGCGGFNSIFQTWKDILEMQDTVFSDLARIFFSLTSHCSKRSEKKSQLAGKRPSVLFTTAVAFCRLFTDKRMHLLSFVCHRFFLYSDLRRRSRIMNTNQQIVRQWEEQGSSPSFPAHFPASARGSG